MSEGVKLKSASTTLIEPAGWADPPPQPVAVTRADRASSASRADIVFIPVLDTSPGFAAQALAATEDVTTPVAVVDETVLERNLARMAAFAAEAGVKLRPHAKTHKSPFIAQRQIAHGAAGLTAATLHEAEVFADAGVSDLFIAHPPVGTA